MWHATALVAAQHTYVGQPLATLIGMLQFLGQHRGIEKAQVDALPGQRMDSVGGIADQGQALGHVTLGMTLAQRHADPRVGLQHSAESAFEGALEFGTESFVGQAH
ncbi:hypothetical protein D3C80_1570240 [compost metagenome]